MTAGDAGLAATVVRSDGSREEIVLVADAPASYGAITVRPRDPITLHAGDVIAPTTAEVDLGPELGVHSHRFPKHVVLADAAPPDTYGFMLVMDDKL